MRSPCGPNRTSSSAGSVAGGAEPVRDARVELGGLARLHDEIVLGEPQPQLPGQHVHPLVALVALLLTPGSPAGTSIL